jgi:hypothetical protein
MAGSPGTNSPQVRGLEFLWRPGLLQSSLDGKEMNGVEVSGVGNGGYNPRSLSRSECVVAVFSIQEAYTIDSTSIPASEIGQVRYDLAAAD